MEMVTFPKESGYYWCQGLVSNDPDFDEDNLPSYDDPLDDVRIVYVNMKGVENVITNRTIPVIKITGVEDCLELDKAGAFRWWGPIPMPENIKRKSAHVNG